MNPKPTVKKSMSSRYKCYFTAVDQAKVDLWTTFTDWLVYITVQICIVGLRPLFALVEFCKLFFGGVVFWAAKH